MMTCEWTCGSAIEGETPLATMRLEGLTLEQVYQIQDIIHKHDSFSVGQIIKFSSRRWDIVARDEETAVLALHKVPCEIPFGYLADYDTSYLKTVCEQFGEYIGHEVFIPSREEIDSYKLTNKVHTAVDEPCVYWTSSPVEARVLSCVYTVDSKGVLGEMDCTHMAGFRPFMKARLSELSG